MTVTTEQKVGFFFLMGLIVLAVIIELVEDWNPLRKEYPYYTHFSSSVGLKVGDPVRMAGVEVGKIMTIGIEGLRVKVDFIVYEETEIRSDSTARVRQMNLLGGQFLGLDFGSLNAAILPPGSEIQSAEGTNIDELITSFDQNQRKLFDQIDSIFAKIDNGEGMLGKMLSDDTLYDDLTEAVSSLSKITSKLADTDVAGDLVETLANMRTLTERLKNGEGTLGRMLTDEELYVTVQEAFADLGAVAEKIKNGDGTLGKLLNDQQAYDDLQQTLANFRSISDKIESGQGTLGKLVNDQDLYHDAKTTLNKIEKAADGLNDSGAISALGTVSGALF